MQIIRPRTDFVACNIYVDAQNIRMHLENVGLCDEFDPTRLSALVSQESFAGVRLAPLRLYYYDSIDDFGSETKKLKQRNYLDQVEALPDTHVVVHGLRGHGDQRKQKGVDVQLAVDALEAALSGAVGSIAIASGDGDFAPLAAAIRRAGPQVVVISFENALSNELRSAADRVILLPDRPEGWALEF
ncbi:MAG: NYN domain-containing protein [Actinobacteria bacterium]|nr:NYN domain-containing protein [Actinomycetota bacterium]